MSKYIQTVQNDTEVVLQDSYILIYNNTTQKIKIYGSTTPTQPSNEIWYTTVDGNILSEFGDNPSMFGDNITLISNTYENGKGIAKFSGNVTKFSGVQFSYNDNIKSIYLPENVGFDGYYCVFGGSSNFENINGYTDIFDVFENVTHDMYSFHNTKFDPNGNLCNSQLYSEFTKEYVINYTTIDGSLVHLMNCVGINDSSVYGINKIITIDELWISYSDNRHSKIETLTFKHVDTPSDYLRVEIQGFNESSNLTTINLSNIFTQVYLTNISKQNIIINYDGTIAQWNDIEVDTYQSTVPFTVNCTDGEIIINE